MLFDEIASVTLLEKYTNILVLEMVTGTVPIVSAHSPSLFHR